jgi:hypothetical protein
MKIENIARKLKLSSIVADDADQDDHAYADKEIKEINGIYHQKMNYSKNE